MSVRGLLYMLLGIVLIAIAVGVLAVSPLFWESFKTVIIGSIPPVIAVIGVIIVLIGRELGKLDDFQKNLNKELKEIEETSHLIPSMQEETIGEAKKMISTPGAEKKAKRTKIKKTKKAKKAKKVKKR